MAELPHHFYGPWATDEVFYAQANVMACAYNAAVNSATPRGIRKMTDLIDAINSEERITGRAKLEYLVKKGVIASFKPCPPECGMRPGGLFHAAGCENEGNTDVYRERQRKAEAELPGKERGWWIATVSLVGDGG